MIVSKSDFQSVIQNLMTKAVLSVDTETTSLEVHKDGFLFSIIICDGETSYYFNHNGYHDDVDPELCLSMTQCADGYKMLFADPARKYYYFNWKFDAGMLRREGIEVLGEIHDCMCVARLLDNDLPGYSLKACAARIGLEKSDTVETYINEHKLFDWVIPPGKKTKKKNPHYDRVPLSVIAPYGEIDASITFALGLYQDRRIGEMTTKAIPGLPAFYPLVANEKTLSRTIFDMEWRGVKIDREYCLETLSREETRLSQSERILQELSGKPFVDSALAIGAAFPNLPVSNTIKGNDSFDSDCLLGVDDPAARQILEHRDAKNRADFLNGFLHFADSENILHSSLRQDGTATGRCSSNSPNMQNLTKHDPDDPHPEEFPIRRAVIPRPGFCFVMMDYNAVEYRLLLNYAAALGLIDKVKAGLDVHQATADMAGCTRKEAKAVNFATLYGAGNVKLAKTLGTTPARAAQIKQAIQNAAPEIADLVQRIIAVAERRGYITNWFGRICRYPDKSFCYRAVNHLIQGGCADVVKIAMNRCTERLVGMQSAMVLSIHDELVFEIHESELSVVPALKEIMENVYKIDAPHFLPLTVGVDHSWKSLADKVEGVPCSKT